MFCKHLKGKHNIRSDQAYQAYTSGRKIQRGQRSKIQRGHSDQRVKEDSDHPLILTFHIRPYHFVRFVKMFLQRIADSSPRESNDWPTMIFCYPDGKADHVAESGSGQFHILSYHVVDTHTHFRFHGPTHRWRQFPPGIVKKLSLGADDDDQRGLHSMSGRPDRRRLNLTNLWSELTYYLRQ
jgi:hypothetical protein